MADKDTTPEVVRGIEQQIAELERASASEASRDEIERLRQQIEALRQPGDTRLDDAWQRVLLARHPQRPYTLDYINQLFTDFTELHGDRRFGEFERNLGVAKNILTDRLRKLIGAGVFEQVPAADGGAHKEYALTEKGRGLLPVVVALGQWAACPESRFAPADRKSGKPVQLEFRSADGRRLDPDEVRLAPKTGR